jgi:hypothetical protein
MHHKRLILNPLNQVLKQITRTDLHIAQHERTCYSMKQFTAISNGYTRNARHPVRSPNEMVNLLCMQFDPSSS